MSRARLCVEEVFEEPVGVHFSNCRIGEVGKASRRAWLVLVLVSMRLGSIYFRPVGKEVRPKE